jgi:hypothetical protein
MNNTTLGSTYYFLNIDGKKFGGHHTKFYCFIKDFLDQKTVKHRLLF